MKTTCLLTFVESSEAIYTKYTKRNNLNVLMNIQFRLKGHSEEFKGDFQEPSVNTGSSENGISCMIFDESDFQSSNIYLEKLNHVIKFSDKEYEYTVHTKEENYNSTTNIQEIDNLVIQHNKKIDDESDSEVKDDKISVIKNAEDYEMNINENTKDENVLKTEPLPEIDLPFINKLHPVSGMHVCPLCPRIFETKYKKEYHLFQIHNLRVSRPKNIDNQLQEVSISGNEWPPNVQEMAIIVNGVKRFFCILCPYETNRCDSMKKHLLRVHSKGRASPQFQCEVCGKTYVDKAYLRNHMVSHSTEMHFRCHVCGLGFHRQASLKRHLESHSSEKQFACKLCTYQTNRKHLMYQHISHHETGRIFRCKLCNEKHYTQISLRAHMYSHANNYKSCSLCKVTFSSKERMLLHMRKVHDCYSCEN